MKLRPAKKEDVGFVRSLLTASNLPVDILDMEKGVLWVLEESPRLLGSGAFEFYGEDALLRSVAIAGDRRNRGLGSVLVDLLEAEAVKRKVNRVWLLTESAETFFTRKGYIKVDRSEIVSKGLLDSDEFKHLCATTAVCMRKELQVWMREK